MSDYRCPWCGCEINECDYWEVDPEVDYTVECGDSGRGFQVHYYLDPVFIVTIPGELDRCLDCNAWNGIEGCCGWTNWDYIKKKNRIQVILRRNSIHPIDSCPLGHDKEEV